MSYRITIICDRKLPTGELCGSRRTTATGPGVDAADAIARAHHDAHAEGWQPRREGGWACLAHTSAGGQP